MAEEKLSGRVIASYYGKTLIQTDANKYFIIHSTHHVGDIISFQSSKALEMPSFMFAMAAMNEEDLDDTMSFIKDKWFIGFND